MEYKLKYEIELSVDLDIENHNFTETEINESKSYFEDCLIEEIEKFSLTQGLITADVLFLNKIL